MALQKASSRIGLTALLAGLMLCACERVDEAPRRGDAASSQSDVGADAAPGQARHAGIELGAFAPKGTRADAVVEARLPAADARLMLVPATTLFPGQAHVESGIDNPYAGDAERIAAGKRHFRAFNCAGCHAPLGGGGMGPPLSDEYWIYGGEPAQIYLSIMHGRPQGMPAWSSMLPRRTVWEIVAYIETLDEIGNYATRLGFDAEHAESTTLTARRTAMSEREDR